MKPRQTRYFHVDVFARRALTGNGLAVFLDTDGWSEQRMHELTREMRQFESIFLGAIDSCSASARIFTLQEELPFAGHPVLGAAAVLHRVTTPQAQAGSWRLRLASRSVEVITQRRGAALFAEMDQGLPIVGPPIATGDATAVLAALNLSARDLVADLPLQCVSTGLPYLIVPVTAQALAGAAVRGRELEQHLAAFGARFVYVLDPHAPEGRTWDNLGEVEDAATGSAAGPAAAYLYHHGRAAESNAISLQQGRYAGRASELQMRLSDGRIFVSGDVWPVISGVLDLGAEPM
ncbi:MAG: PhzF family phenazine biosynthesis protein [Rhodanobacteraceae bacterium]|nr:PhzF family phenazine biosynthesis protein [Rhodanobacteraceae bacterium]